MLAAKSVHRRKALLIRPLGFPACTKLCHFSNGKALCQASTTLSVTSKFQQMVDWIESCGGHVCDCLRPAETAIATSRGLVAAKPVTAQRLQAGPLIMVPDKLQMSVEDAQRLLDPVLKADGGPSVSLLSDQNALALLLAFERNKGESSIWYQYIQALPVEPEAGWHLALDSLGARLAEMGRQAADWAPQIAVARKYVMADVREVWGKYGTALGISQEQLAWALAQVESRSFGEPAKLLPVIDMLRHDARAMPPVNQRTEDPGVRVMCAYSMCNGQPRSLEEGEELFTCHTLTGASSALEAFVHLGAVPPELWSTESSSSSSDEEDGGFGSIGKRS